MGKTWPSFSRILSNLQINRYLEFERLALSSILIFWNVRHRPESGGTIDKFIGDAVLVFFGDPDSEGEREDALKCIEMGLKKKRAKNCKNTGKNLEWQMEFPSVGIAMVFVLLGISAQTFVSTILYLAVRWILRGWN